MKCDTRVPSPLPFDLEKRREPLLLSLTGFLGLQHASAHKESATVNDNRSRRIGTKELKVFTKTNIELIIEFE